ncbi:centaurin-gamma-1A-like isoform X2 [Varroa jacobsoni]|nr:centaurin-gamma-1A-like isoform X2 [Varroa destructor]XP_022658243.1 centaurin-gamma-1A-like isoform X2 [Varroa destructor]XP_022705002.1 centaurin-gamma-1A-like isoform X2 [Varroa jacobsoni]
MMIRDEAGSPEWQFAQWVDAVLLVFSLENEGSFQEILAFYKKMRNFRNDVPVVLVGTQDAISENNPRKISDQRARKLAQELGNCAYYETCATYGLNVEKVFSDLCHRLVVEGAWCNRTGVGVSIGGPSTISSVSSGAPPVSGPASTSLSQSQQSHSQDDTQHQPTSFFSTAERQQLQQQQPNQPRQLTPTSTSSAQCQLLPTTSPSGSDCTSKKLSLTQPETSPTPVGGRKAETPSKLEGLIPLTPSPTSKSCDSKLSLVTDKTPVGTPNAARKNKRRSNLFSKDKDKDRDKKDVKANGGSAAGSGGNSHGEYGSGRSIPVKQGYLLKSSSKGLNKEAKKKRYVTLTKDGILTYHATINDYMNNHGGKEIELMQTTVKIPGQNPRGCQNLRLIPNTNPILSTKETPLTKKRSHHKRIKSGSGSKLLEDVVHGGQSGSCGVEDLEFVLISLSTKMWRFEAATMEERDEWVTAIEQLIMDALQACESARAGGGDDIQGQQQAINALKYQVAGNRHCVDCDAPNPDWASLNHGALMCITCSGIHRQLGSHISRVRSLNLDDWSPDQLAVMEAVGNAMANAIWEANTRSEEGKPTPNSSREEKERWIRAKYLEREFLKGLPRQASIGGPALSRPSGSAQALLLEGIEAADVARVLLALAHGANADASVGHGSVLGGSSGNGLVNCVSSALGGNTSNISVHSTDQRSAVHVAVAKGNTAIVQLMLMASGRENLCKDGVLKEVQERKV